MTTFDGSTTYPQPGDPNAPGVGPLTTAHYETPPPAGPDTAGGGSSGNPSDGYDAFEALREQLAERDADEDDVSHVEIPGIGWRLVCSLDFTYPQYKEWQKAALPKSQRNGRKTNPLDMDQAMLSYLVLLNTCEAVEYKRADGGWEQLSEPDGAPSTLKTGTMLNRMGVVDPRLLVKKLFRGDGRLIAAGQKVISDAGYGEQDGDGGGDGGGDAGDPTE